MAVSKPVPPPPPPPRKTVVATSQTYKLNTVPFSLLKKVVQSFSVDFLKTGSHVIFRANFLHPIMRDTKSAPKGTTGLVLDQGMSSGQDIECSLMLKTIKYDGPHRQALKTVDLPLAGKKTVRDFVNLIRKAHLVPFWPFFNGSENVGCRDWGSQLIYQLRAGDVLTSSSEEDDGVYTVFNFKNGVDGERTPTPVECGTFSPAYHRIDIPGVVYAGKGDIKEEEKEKEKEKEKDV